MGGKQDQESDDISAARTSGLLRRNRGHSPVSSTGVRAKRRSAHRVRQALVSPCIGEVLPGGLFDGGWANEAVGLPIGASVDHPAEDPRPLVLKLFLEFQVWLRRLVDERHDIDAPPHSVVDVAQARLVVAGNSRFEFRFELK